MGNLVQVLPFTLSDHHCVVENITKVGALITPKSKPNHHSMVANITKVGAVITPRSKPDGFSLNTSLLHDDDVMATIKIIQWFNYSMGNNPNPISRWVQSKVLGKKREKDASVEISLTISLIALESKLQNDLANVTAILKLKESNFLQLLNTGKATVDKKDIAFNMVQKIQDEQRLGRSDPPSSSQWNGIFAY